MANRTVHIGSQSIDVNNNTQAALTALITILAQAIPRLSHIAIGIYFDYDSTHVNDQFNRWATAIHAAGKKMSIRSAGHNDWIGQNSVSQYVGTDFATHAINQIGTWIDNNYTIFQSGDVFEPFPDEPENNSLWNTYYNHLSGCLPGTAVITIDTAGTGYAVNDFVAVTGGSGTITIASVTNGSVTGITVPGTSQGGGYTTGTFSTTKVTGSGAGLKLAFTAGKTAFNNFLTSAATAATAKFGTYGVTGVTIGPGWCNPSTTKDTMLAATAGTLGYVGVDSYPENGLSTPADMATAMQTQMNTYGSASQTTVLKDITFGPSVYSQLTQADQADAWSQEFNIVATTVTDLAGVTVWQFGATDNGPKSRLFDYTNSTWVARSVVGSVNALFHNIASRSLAGSRTLR